VLELFLQLYHAIFQVEAFSGPWFFFLAISSSPPSRGFVADFCRPNASFREELSIKFESRNVSSTLLFGPPSLFRVPFFSPSFFLTSSFSSLGRSRRALVVPFFCFFSYEMPACRNAFTFPFLLFSFAFLREPLFQSGVTSEASV